MSAAITFEHVGLTLGRDVIYDSVDFEVAAGEFVCLLGPSGCGKSTALRIIGDLLPPGAGRVLVNGKPPVASWSDIAFVFQSPRLAPWRNALTNVLLGAELRFGRAEAKKRAGKASDLLALVGLADGAANSADAVRRRAPARRHRPRAGRRSLDRADGRAVLRARPQHPAPSARRDRAHLAGDGARRSCSSRTTSRRRWSWPTASC